MLLYIAIALVITYLIYTWLIKRISWWSLRYAAMIPLLLVTGFVLLLLSAQQSTRAAISEREALQENIIARSAAIRSDLVISISAAGAITPRRQVPLAFQASASVAEINAHQGDSVDAGDIIASLNTIDLAQNAEDSRVAFDLQQSSFDALTQPPRDIDIAAAEAALNAAQGQVYSALETAPSAEAEEIARLQLEVAGNRNWQAQLARDAIAPSVTDLLGNPDDLETGRPIIDNVILDPLNEGIDLAVGEINALIDQQNAAAIRAAQAAREDATAAARQVEYGIFIAQEQYQTVLNRGPNAGSLAAANAQRTQARIALDNLLNGPSQLQLDRARVDLQLAELAVEQAEYSIAQAELRAPFAGVIAQNNLREGDLPPQGIAVLLMDTSTFYVDLPIDEVDVVRLREGQRVLLSVDALPDVTLTGRVVRIAYTPVQVGQLITYTARVELEPTAQPIRVGMSTTARVIVEEKPDVILVPNRFIRIDRSTQDAFVTVQDPDGAVREMMVLLGDRNETYTEIVNGLSAGDQIVLLPQDS